MKKLFKISGVLFCFFALIFFTADVAVAQGQGQGQGQGLTNNTGCANGHGFTNGQGHINGNSAVDCGNSNSGPNACTQSAIDAATFDQTANGRTVQCLLSFTDDQSFVLVVTAGSSNYIVTYSVTGSCGYTIDSVQFTSTPPC